MNDKIRKLLQIGAALMGLCSLFFFFNACIFGQQQRWATFGLSLMGCLLMVVFVTYLLLRLDIDRRFNQLEKHIDELRANKQ